MHFSLRTSSTHGSVRGEVVVSDKRLACPQSLIKVFRLLNCEEFTASGVFVLFSFGVVENTVPLGVNTLVVSISLVSYVSLSRSLGADDLIEG